jgi:hypothetical protein
MSASHNLQKNPSLLQDVWAYLLHTKKWYLIPVVIVFLVLGVVIVLGGTAAAPFIYTLF